MHAKPRAASIRLNGDAAGTPTAVVVPGEAGATGPAIGPDRLTPPPGRGLPTSRDMPLVAKAAVPFWAVAEVTEKPNTCIAVPKLPVPPPACVHTTVVPPFSTWAVHARLVVSKGDGKSVEVGPVAAVTPERPLNVMVVLL